MFSVQSRVCGEGAGTAFARLEVSMLEVSHLWRTGVVLIYGGWGSKLIVRQTERSAIPNLGLFFLAKS